jgi:hypothetical protein
MGKLVVAVLSAGFRVFFFVDWRPEPQQTLVSLNVRKFAVVDRGDLNPRPPECKSGVHTSLYFLKSDVFRNIDKHRLLRKWSNRLVLVEACFLSFSPLALKMILA